MNDFWCFVACFVQVSIQCLVAGWFAHATRKVWTVMFKPLKTSVGARQILLETFRFCLFRRSGHEHNGDYHGLTFQCWIQWFVCIRAGMFANSRSTYAFHDFLKKRLSFHVAEINWMRWNSVHWCCISRFFCLNMLGKVKRDLHTHHFDHSCLAFLTFGWKWAELWLWFAVGRVNVLNQKWLWLYWCAYGSKILQH